MKAVVLKKSGDGKVEVALQHNHPIPHHPDEALIKIRRAGICNTDLELIKGYLNFEVKYIILMQLVTYSVIEILCKL